jgi:lipoic acid synthetase
VVTSVTRDDLNDGGASIFAATVRAVRDLSPECGIELLLPDFKSSLEESVREVCLSRPDVINHNIEVAGPLYGQLRPRGDYGASLALLEAAGGYGIPVKSGLMIGFGESMDDIRHTLEDLRSTGCTILTVGQYLQSRREGFPVAKYYSPQEFLEIEAMALGLGFASVQSGPLVRSSYRAAAMAGGPAT